MAEELVEKNKPRRKILHKITILMLWLAMVIFASHACTHMVAAGDTWVAMACGRHFVNHGVDTVEPFSANSHKAGPTEEELAKFPEWSHGIIKKIHPTGWINQNWLTHVIFYKLTTMFGSVEEPNYDMLVVWKFLVVFLAMMCIYFSSRLAGGGAFISAALCCAAMFISRSFIDIRPAVFSNLFVPLYVYTLLLTVRKDYRYIWLSVPIAVLWANLHGGYLYMFIVLVMFFVINSILWLTKWDSAFYLDLKGLFHTAGAGVASFFAMVILNPYHLTNLTHTFIISISEHAKDWKKVNEWHSAFEFSNPVGNSYPFAVMFYVFWVVVLLWLIFWLAKPRFESKQQKKLRQAVERGYDWPKVDIANIAIVMFTVIMAVRSRRFIPIAAYVACPLMSVFLTQIWKMLTAKLRLAREDKFEPAGFSAKLEALTLFVAVAVIVGFGGWFVLKFDKIYLKPWPNDAKRDSIFMRMTASNLKPFDACQFIRENELEGNMLNYWTEGGFIAFEQTPNPETGEIPLKLFMDGRAQAAYDIEMFNLYNSRILTGGPVGIKVMQGANANQRSFQCTMEEKRQIGDWLRPYFTEYNVWLILMPRAKFSSPFLQGVEAMDEWRLVFHNDKQKIFINIETPEGKDLFTSVVSRKCKYPTVDDEHVIESLYTMKYRRDYKTAYEKAFSAFDNNHSLTALRLLMSNPDPECRKKLTPYVSKVLKDILKKTDLDDVQAGLMQEMRIAIFCADYLSRADSKNSAKYKNIIRSLRQKQMLLNEEHIW